jgi:hypothetical protein
VTFGLHYVIQLTYPFTRRTAVTELTKSLRIIFMSKNVIKQITLTQSYNMRMDDRKRSGYMKFLK